MKRSAPMKRTAWPRRRPLREKVDEPARAASAMYRLTRPVVYADTSAPPAPAPKRDYVRSGPLMKAYRAIPCQHCGRDDGTVCGAHANWSVFGKGGHIKADDNRAASLCAACHVPILDQGSKLTREERKAMFWAAHVKTVLKLLELALWPARIPVPDITTNPFQ